MSFCYSFNGECPRNQGPDCFTCDQMEHFLFVSNRGMNCATTDDLKTFETPRLCVHGCVFSTQVPNQNNAFLGSASLDTVLKIATDQLNYQIDTPKFLEHISHIVLFMIDHQICP